MTAREVIDIPSEASFLTGENIGKNAAWFRKRLAENGIRPPLRSVFGDALAALETIDVIARKATIDKSAEEQIVDAIAAALLVGAAKCLETRCPRLLEASINLFRGSDVLLARPGDRNAARDAALEFLWAAIASVGGSAPVLGGSANPDVRFKIRDQDWGVECKVVYSSTAKRIADEADKKLSQLRDGPATHGLAVVDLTAVLEHTPRFQLSLDAASGQLHQSLLELKSEILRDGRLLRKLQAIFPKAEALIFSAHSAVLTQDSIALLASFYILSARRLIDGAQYWLRRIQLGYKTVLMQDTLPRDARFVVRDRHGRLRESDE